MHFFRPLIASLIMGFAAFGMTVSSAQALPTLLVDGGGQLTGADNVDLGSLGSFDVRFLEGTCAAVFTGCDNAAADFDFQTDTDAAAAAQALMDQVFVGIFDTDPTLTLGCGSLPDCIALVPYGFDSGFIETGQAHNNVIEIVDISFLGLSFQTNDTSRDVKQVFARFTRAATTVPEPGTLALFGLGLLGLGLVQRRR